MNNVIKFSDLMGDNNSPTQTKLKEGYALITIEKSEVGVSKEKKTPYLNFTCKIQRVGETINQKLFERIYIKPKNPTAAGLNPQERKLKQLILFSELPAKENAQYTLEHIAKAAIGVQFIANLTYERNTDPQYQPRLEINVFTDTIYISTDRINEFKETKGLLDEPSPKITSNSENMDESYIEDLQQYLDDENNAPDLSDY